MRKLNRLMGAHDEITIDEVHDLLVSEFNVEYIKKQVWVILTKKLIINVIY